MFVVPSPQELATTIRASLCTCDSQGDTRGQLTVAAFVNWICGLRYPSRNFLLVSGRMRCTANKQTVKGTGHYSETRRGERTVSNSGACDARCQVLNKRSVSSQHKLWTRASLCPVQLKHQISLRL